MQIAKLELKNINPPHFKEYIIKINDDGLEVAWGRISAQKRSKSIKANGNLYNELKKVVKTRLEHDYTISAVYVYDIKAYYILENLKYDFGYPRYGSNIRGLFNPIISIVEREYEPEKCTTLRRRF